MKRIKFHKIGLICLVIGLVAIIGCEPETTTSSEPLPNNGEGLDHFSYAIGWQEMKTGESDSVVVEVRPNQEYDVYLTGANDGDSDAVSVHVDDNEIGSYIIGENRSGGYGWYETQYSPHFQFSSTNSIVTLWVRVDGADWWGTKIQRIYVDKLEDVIAEVK